MDQTSNASNEENNGQGNYLTVPLEVLINDKKLKEKIAHSQKIRRTIKRISVRAGATLGIGAMLFWTAMTIRDENISKKYEMIKGYRAELSDIMKGTDYASSDKKLDAFVQKMQKLRADESVDLTSQALAYHDKVVLPGIVRQKAETFYNSMLENILNDEDYKKGDYVKVRYQVQELMNNLNKDTRDIGPVRQKIISFYDRIKYDLQGQIIKGDVAYYEEQLAGLKEEMGNDYQSHQSSVDHLVLVIDGREEPAFNGLKQKVHFYYDNEFKPGFDKQLKEQEEAKAAEDKRLQDIIDANWRERAEKGNISVNNQLTSSQQRIVEKQRTAQSNTAPTVASSRIVEKKAETNWEVVEFDAFEDSNDMEGWYAFHSLDRGKIKIVTNHGHSSRNSLQIMGADAYTQLETGSLRLGVQFYEWTRSFDASESSKPHLPAFSAQSYYTFSSGKPQNVVLLVGANALTDSKWKYMTPGSTNFNDLLKHMQQISHWKQARDLPKPTTAEAKSWHRWTIEVYGPEGKAKFWYDGDYKGEIDIPVSNQPIDIFRHGIGSPDMSPGSMPEGRESRWMYGFLDDVKFYKIDSYPARSK